MQVVTGVEDPCFSKFKVDGAMAASFFRRNSDARADLSTSSYNMSGFLWKKGGSKGGRRNWTSVRAATRGGWGAWVCLLCAMPCRAVPYRAVWCMCGVVWCGASWWVVVWHGKRAHGRRLRGHVQGLAVCLPSPAPTPHPLCAPFPVSSDGMCSAAAAWSTSRTPRTRSPRGSSTSRGPP